jgi:hypothetical protein
MLSLAGCATQPRVPTAALMQYTSHPSGALVVRNGVAIGRTPFAYLARLPEGLTFVTTNGRSVPRCSVGDVVTFMWASGAKAVVDTCQSRGGYVPGFPVVTAARPMDAPGLDQDLLAQEKSKRTLNPTHWASEYERLGLPDIHMRVPSL